MCERQEASGVECAHLKLPSPPNHFLVGSALLRGGAGARSAGGGRDPDHQSVKPSELSALPTPI